MRLKTTVVIPAKKSMQTDKEKATAFHNLFPTQEIASRMASLAISKKPIGVSGKSSYPYYKEFYASKLIESINAMIESGESLLFSYEVYCDCENPVTKETLYKMINQSIRYLVENMDNEDLKYLTWRNSVEIHRMDHGILIEYSRGFKLVSGEKDFKGTLVSPTGDGTPKWRVELDEWLEGDSMKPFVKERLTLSLEEVTELKLQLAEDIRIMCSVDCTSVRIIKK